MIRICKRCGNKFAGVRCKICLRRYQKLHSRKTRNKRRVYEATYRQKNRKKLRLYDSQWKRKWRKLHPELSAKIQSECYYAHQTQRLMAKSVSLQVLKLEVYNAYGGAFCKCCKEDHIEFLSIDHIKDNGAAHRRAIFGDSRSGSSERMYRWLKRNGFPKGFQILCMNCNCAKHRYGRCPHDNL